MFLLNKILSVCVGSKKSHRKPGRFVCEIEIHFEKMISNLKSIKQYLHSC